MQLHLLFDAGWIVVLHVVFALAAFGLGLVVLFRRKGGIIHRWMGRIWVAFMVLVCVSSFFIHELRMVGPFSPIHLLSLYTLGALTLSVLAIRKRDVARHKQGMQQAFFFGLVVAGGFTFLPNRLFAHVLGDGTLAKVAPFVWVAIPLAVYAVFRMKNVEKSKPVIQRH